MKCILLIEDEQAMARGISDALQHNGYEVTNAGDGESGLNLLEEKKPDLILLDIMLPGMDGLEVCRILRERGFTLPVIMLTARSEEVDMVLGLEFGADDYVTKPFSIRELITRIKAHLRRADHFSLQGIKEYSFGDIRFDFSAHKALRNGKPVKLTAIEFSLLRYLIQNKNQVVSRDNILNEVWGYDIVPDSRIVDTHILNLRKKLEKDAHNPDYILTHHGVGYKFVG